MHSTGLAAPAATPRRDALGPESTRISAARTGARRPSPYDRVLRWALLVSVLLHLFVLLISPSFIRIGLPPGWTNTPYQQAGGGNEIQLINPVVVEGAPDLPAPVVETRPLETVRPTPAPAPVRRPAPAARPGPSAPAAAAPSSAAPGAAPARPSVGERLQPGVRDPRLYVNPRDIAHPTEEQTAHQRYMEHFQARIDALNDSMAVAGRGPNKDWTATDKEGRRWGLSEDGLHLGGFTVPRALVPLPGPTGDNQQIEAEREKQRQREEIIRQEGDRTRDEAREESTAETRARKDAEREKARSGS